MISVGILGSGNIGVDLAMRVLCDTDLNLVLVAGRRADSAGLSFLNSKVPTSSNGIIGLLDHLEDMDVVFDATSSEAHELHWQLLEPTNRLVIDLTPSNIGMHYVPFVLNPHVTMGEHKLNLSMISCGGQASIPVINAISKTANEVSYIEVSSSIASKSAGIATRENLDDYIHSTESAIMNVVTCKQVKVVLILNPALPEVFMRTTIQVRAKWESEYQVQRGINLAVRQVQTYVPGYRIVDDLEIDGDILSLTVGVEGSGYHLPKYAGNLDIITSAAIAAAKTYLPEIPR
jgi:acetaldehyde dehydrogenase